MNILMQDVRSALRRIAANPRFAFFVILTLALGIGPTCIIFTIVDSIYFKPLPYPDQAALVLPGELELASGNIVGTHPLTFREWQNRSRTLGGIAAYQGARFNLNLDNSPEVFPGQYISAQFFQILGAAPALGRGFQPLDFESGQADAVIVSHSLWKGYFAGRGDIVGLSVRLNGRPVTVVGVMPPDFRSFMEGRTAKLWVPHIPPRAGSPESLEPTGAVARLAPGATALQARAELDSILGELRRQFPDIYRQRGISLRNFKDSQFAGLGPGLRMLCVMVGLVLLIACGNAANLMLGRAMARKKEMGIRLALGAGRIRLMRQLITESLVLSLIGAAAGLLLTLWGVDFVWSRTAAMFLAIGAEPFAIDRRILLFTLCLATVTTLLFGVMPAWRGSKVRPFQAIKGNDNFESRGLRRNRLSRILVVFQVTLCVVCLLGTALMVKSFLHFAELSNNPGFRSENLVHGSIPFERNAGTEAARWPALCEEFRGRAAGLPGVHGSTLADGLPFLDRGMPVTFTREWSLSHGVPEHDAQIRAHSRLVGAGFFELFGIPMLRGRSISERDDSSAQPVAVINDSLARQYWKNADPLGERILLEGGWKTVVGVVADSIRESPFSPSPNQVYLSHLQSRPTDMKVIVKSGLDPRQLIPVLREQLRGVNRDQPLVEVGTVESALSRFMDPFRLILSLMALFGMIALSLAGVGLYGVVSQAASRRTREIGIRSALGAPRKKILSMVLMEGFRMTGTGIPFGLILGIALVKVLPSQILGVTPLSPLYFVGVPLFLGVLSILACLVPARKAASVDPVEVLRHE